MEANVPAKKDHSMESTEDSITKEIEDKGVEDFLDCHSKGWVISYARGHEEYLLKRCLVEKPDRPHDDWTTRLQRYLVGIKLATRVLRLLYPDADHPMRAELSSVRYIGRGIFREVVVIFGVRAPINWKSSYL